MLKHLARSTMAMHRVLAISPASGYSLTSFVLSSGQKNFKLHDLDTYDGKANPE
jgi:hypothetical protein